MDRICPKCARSFDAKVSHCRADGVPLIHLAPEPSLVGTVLDGRYRLTDELAEGGMGTVYAGRRIDAGAEVAVKVLMHEFAADFTAVVRFLREAHAAARLSHPNTIRVFDSGRTADGRPYLVMERLDGRPLHVVVEQEGPLRPARAVHILTQICGSLAEAHARGIIHRDLKPDNVFVQPRNGDPDFVKVLDFGIAKLTDGSGKLTVTGSVCGTPGYMSPEQCVGDAVDHRSDIYCLGLLLYELLAGRPPFDGPTALDLAMQHLREEVPPVPNWVRALIPDRLVEVMLQTLSKDPEERPQSCEELVRLLREAMGGGTGRTTSDRDVSLAYQRTLPALTPVRGDRFTTVRDQLPGKHEAWPAGSRGTERGVACVTLAWGT